MNHPRRRLPGLVLAVAYLLMSAGCSTTAATHGGGARALSSIALPGAAGPISMDYLAYDPVRRRVWAPAGETGSVDVVDLATGTVIRVEGFATGEQERKGNRRRVGPSSVTLGRTAAYIGNRADSSVCEVDAQSLRLGACLKLDARPDGLAYVASLGEVWVTVPSEKQIQILDVKTAGAIVLKQKLQLEGEPEGYAVDDVRGLFFTNYEDLDRTLVIDIATRQTKQTWSPGCGTEGPRGIALAGAQNHLVVACTDHLVVLDAGHDGALLSRLVTGKGLDNIEYLPSRREVLAAAGKAGTLTVAQLGAGGTLSRVAVVPTAEGARNAVGTEAGTAYLADGREGKLLVVAEPGP